MWYELNINEKFLRKIHLRSKKNEVNYANWLMMSIEGVVIVVVVGGGGGL